ncbi:MAG TPA: hypothetical protein VD737_08205 [Steroidobacteraceae bacterium]|nr:hypothetical protein [Steroidobacteraceae bacterium]
MTSQGTRPFASCSEPELLEHAIARLAARHGDRGVIADHLRMQLAHLRQTEMQRRLLQARPKPFA